VSLGALPLLLSEFDREMGATRRVLARVPDTYFLWQPHERSMTLGGLTAHIASLPGWLATIVRENAFDLIDVPVESVADSCGRGRRAPRARRHHRCAPARAMDAAQGRPRPRLGAAHRRAAH
jgi:hypothetical protein